MFPCVSLMGVPSCCCHFDRADVNAGVKDLICGLLEKDPAQRYSLLDFCYSLVLDEASL